MNFALLRFAQAGQVKACEHFRIRRDHIAAQTGYVSAHFGAVVRPVRHDHKVGRGQHGRIGDADGQAVQLLPDLEGPAALDGKGIEVVFLVAGPEQSFAGGEGSVCSGQAVVVGQRQDAYGTHRFQSGSRGGDDAAIEAARVQDAVFKAAAGIQHGIENRVLRMAVRRTLNDLLQLVLHFRRAVRRGVESGNGHHVIGVAAAQGVVAAEVEAAGGREHHQHHGGQDADGGQTRAVALHAEGHGRNGNEVVRLVIIALFLLQQFT